MKIIDKIWFTHGNNCIGIIIAENETTKERKAYIGCGFGLDEGADAYNILDWGAKFPLSTLESILKLLKGENHETTYD